MEQAGRQATRKEMGNRTNRGRAVLAVRSGTNFLERSRSESRCIFPIRDDSAPLLVNQTPLETNAT
jgi:hypothetical protein